MNIFDIILVLLITAAVIFAVRSTVKQHRKGGCCGSCTGCPHGKDCTGIK
ncbi:MAG: FeoB-associated Cys-rich membrane protein [Ruminococcus sp.]|nr:FeoB-associated Cys-rich membrane protein [Ruminococcus sp.]MBP5578341.1 FeoB-associated Cys-rich membrane protein [Ruminococcus sp.]